MSSPIKPLPQKQPIPFTLHEALYGNDNLEPCVNSLKYQWSPEIVSRFLNFQPIMARPKQAIQHLLELFIIHICILDVSWDAKWVTNLIQYLSAISQHLIPPVNPIHIKQWTALVRDKRGRITQRVAQLEEAYPKDQKILSEKILDIIASYSESFKEPDLTCEVLSQMTGLMDEPAKTVIIVYAWFLQLKGIRNGWLRKYLSSSLGRRERRRKHVPIILHDRIDRADEELHTLFSHPFVDKKGHLVWNTVRSATREVIYGLSATSYARSNNVRINSSKDVSKSVQIHPSHICNLPVLDLRMWESWILPAHGNGPYSSLARQSVPTRTIRFDSPVFIESALAVGFRIIHGNLYNPDGHQLKIIRRSDGLYKAQNGICRTKNKEEINWHTGMEFA